MYTSSDKVNDTRVDSRHTYRHSQTDTADIHTDTVRQTHMHTLYTRPLRLSRHSWSLDTHTNSPHIIQD